MKSKMIKQILSEEIKYYLMNNPKCVLLDVRTKEEWNEGKPDGDKIGIKTYFLSLQFKGQILNENFAEEFKNLKINQDYEILISCGTGGRSQRAAEILTLEGYKCSNISDGFLGNNENIGWKANNLPVK
tara:strand:- start:195 stop:581 length:387 start_codon:yes stop_codon:yes gene_type:complete